MDISVIKEILEVCKRLDNRGLVNAYEGNVSVKKDGYIYITPAGQNKAFLTEEKIIVLEEKTLKQISGIGKPSSELILHTSAYKTRSDIFAVVHAHPTMLTAYALCGKDVQTKAYPEMIGNFKIIPCAPYGRPGCSEIFDVARDYIIERDVVLLGNHGVISVGKTALDAMNKVEAAESIAKVLYYAERIGVPVKDLPDSEVQMFLDK